MVGVAPKPLYTFATMTIRGYKMPQNEQHNKNKIVYYLMRTRTSDVIEQKELDEAIKKAGIHSKKSRTKYTNEMEEEGTISRVAGGWTLAEECYKTGRIFISVKPDASTIAVMDAVADAVRRFRPLATVETEL